MKRGEKGGGSIRKRKDGRWEGRVTTGYDESGKRTSKSMYGKTQAEVAKKMREVTTSVDAGTYKEPSKLTVEEWCDIWLKTYTVDVKPRTVESYSGVVRNHIVPMLGRTKLECLTAHDIQRFLNACADKGLSPKTCKNIRGVLCEIVGQAAKNGIIRQNPAVGTKTQRAVKSEIRPFNTDDMMNFMEAVKGTDMEYLFVFAMFSGLRRGEVCGLTWDCVDFGRSTVFVNKQLAKVVGAKAEFSLFETKTGNERIVAIAPSIMRLLRAQKRKQAEDKLRAGSLWVNTDYVFTNEIGDHVSPHTVYHRFKAAAAKIGRPDARFHDLRHTYAVSCLRAGDDTKTLQSNLGHSTITTTMDIYAHVIDEMKQRSADRMETYLRNVIL